MPDAVLDVFNSDAFGVIELSHAFATPPFVPGAAGMAVPWQERGVATRTIMVEEQGGEIAILNPRPYNAPGETFADVKRTARPLAIPHYAIEDAVMADEVQGVRAFGEAQATRSVGDLLSQRMADRLQNKFDPTLEFQRLGALRGIIVNGDTTTYLNLFTAFGVTQEAEVDFDLDNATPASGALRKVCAQTVRTITNNAQGLTITSVGALCGDAFFDDLLSHPEVVLSYRNSSMAEVLRQGYVLPNGNKIYGAFEFGGIVWQNYRGSIGGTPFVNTDKTHLFPMGTPGLYNTVYAPAGFWDTVNQPGLKRYARQYMRLDGRGVNVQMEMNTLNFCSRPKTLVQGKRT